MNRVGIMISETHLVETLARIRVNPIQKYIDDSQYKLWIFCMLELSPHERWMLSGCAKAQVGKLYAPVKIAAYLGDWLVNWPFGSDVHIFRRLIFTKAMMICSETVARDYWEVLEYLFADIQPEEATPDDMWDHCMKSDDFE